MSTQANTLKIEIETHIKKLATLTSEASRSDAMKEYFDTCAKFYHYSPFNQLLILLSRPDASFVAGYYSWQKFNRFVKRGEKGIPILAPIIFKADPEDETSPNVLRGFKTVYVWDISQTDGQPLPHMPHWKSTEKSVELQNRLIAYAESKGISIEVGDLIGEAQGMSTGGRIKLSTQAGTKTFVHELAHELLHQGINRHGLTRSEMELEAEAIAYVVAVHFGISDLASPNYLALWDAASEKILARMDRIRSTAAEIIEAIELLAE
jgi:hypothetical protein